MDEEFFRKARVRVTKSDNPRSWYARNIGDIFDVKIYSNDQDYFIVDDDDDLMYRTIARGDLELIEDEDDKLLDALASLSKEVARLKSRVKTLEFTNKSLKNDLITWAEETTAAKHTAEGAEAKAEMLIDDVVMLDERTAVK